MRKKIITLTLLTIGSSVTSNRHWLLSFLVGEVESRKFKAKVPEHARLGHVDGGDRHLELLGHAGRRLMFHGRQPKCAPSVFGKVCLHQRHGPACQLGVPLLAAAIISLAGSFVRNALKSEVRCGAALGIGLAVAITLVLGILPGILTDIADRAVPVLVAVTP